MRDRPVIYAGLAVFLAAAAFPLWRNALAGAGSRPPDVKLPATEKQCVAPRAYMRNAHMDLLIQWRENAVRNGVRQFTSFDGKNYEVSLTGTCLRKCHTAKADFCDRCHNYAAVTQTCWDCHLDPAPARPGTVASLLRHEVVR